MPPAGTGSGDTKLQFQFLVPGQGAFEVSGHAGAVVGMNAARSLAGVTAERRAANTEQRGKFRRPGDGGFTWRPTPGAETGSSSPVRRRSVTSSCTSAWARCSSLLFQASTAIRPKLQTISPPSTPESTQWTLFSRFISSPTRVLLRT